MTGNAMRARWHATSPAGQTLMSPADGAGSRRGARWPAGCCATSDHPRFRPGVTSSRALTPCGRRFAKGRAAQSASSNLINVGVDLNSLVWRPRWKRGVPVMKQDHPAEAKDLPVTTPLTGPGQPAASGRYTHLPCVRGKRCRARSALARYRAGPICHGPMNVGRPVRCSEVRLRRSKRCHDRRPSVRGRDLGFCLLVHARRSWSGAVRQSAAPPPGHGRRLLASLATRRSGANGWARSWPERTD